MEDGLTIALSPVQLVAVLSPHTVTEAEALSNRLLGGLELALGTVELMGATALCLAPDPTLLTKAACVATGAHSMDAIHTAADRILTGHDTRTATFQSAAALARQFGAAEDTAWTIGLTVDIAVPSAAGIAWGLSRIKYVRAGTLKLAEHEGIKKIGGHTIRKHVAISDEALLARLRQSPGLPAATSFYNVQQAERFISAALRSNRLKIIHWANTGRIAKPLELTWDAGTTVGYGFRQGSRNSVPVSRVRVVLKGVKYNGKPYFILTAYPFLR